jgi:hypothetical protein
MLGQVTRQVPYFPGDSEPGMNLFLRMEILHVLESSVGHRMNESALCSPNS